MKERFEEHDPIHKESVYPASRSLIISSANEYEKLPVSLGDRIDSYLGFSVRTVPFYNKLYSNKVGINHKGLYDLPLATPQDLLDDPYGFVSGDGLPVQISSSGGTYGKKKIIFRTNEDLYRSRNTGEKIFTNCGVVRGDRLAIVQPFDLWNIGHIALDTFKNMGVLSLPVGTSADDREIIDLIKFAKINVIYCTPSRAITLVRVSKETGRGLNVERVLCAGEPITPAQRGLVKEAWGADIYGIYGSEETDGIGSECGYHSGYHLFDDSLLIELLNPETFLPAEKDEGVMAITKLDNKGTVLTRYLLGDKAKILYDPCACGLEGVRVIPMGRLQETLFLYNGTKVPLDAVDKMLGFVFTEIPQYQILVDQRGEYDQVSIKIDASLSDDDIRLLLQEFKKCGQDLEAEINHGKIKIDFTPTKVDEFYVTERGKSPKFAYVNNRDTSL